MLSCSPEEFLSIGQLPRGAGPGTLEQLIALGLAERRAITSSSMKSAWRITEAGAALVLMLKTEAPAESLVPSWVTANQAPAAAFRRCGCQREKK